jgi:hypothetical protein
MMTVQLSQILSKFTSNHFTQIELPSDILKIRSSMIRVDVVPRSTRYIPSSPLEGLRANNETKRAGKLLADFLSKKTFGKGKTRQWDQQYIFAEHSSDESVVNDSLKSISDWVDKNLLGIRDKKNETQSKDFLNSLCLLIGPTGSGKSTFNKYVSTKFFDKFVQHKRIVSRIEQRKLYDYIKMNQASFSGQSSELRKMTIGNLCSKFICASIARDFFHLNFSTHNKSKSNDNDTKTFTPTSSQSFSKKDDSKKLDVETELNKIGTEVDDQLTFYLTTILAGQYTITDIKDRIVKFHNKGKYDFTIGNNRESWVANNLQDSDFPLSCFLYLLVIKQICSDLECVTIFDGLDFVQAADFGLKTLQADVFSAVCDLTVNHKLKLRFDGITTFLQPKPILTMRNCTFGYFASSYKAHLGNPGYSVSKIKPPEYQKIIEFMDSVLVDKYSIPEIYAGKFTDRLMREFERLENFVDHNDISEMFQGNIRHRLNYTKNLIDYVYENCHRRWTSKDKMKYTFLQFYLDFSDDSEGQDGFIIPAYKLFDFLTHAGNLRFSNFCRVSSISRWREQQLRSSNPYLLEDILTDTDIGSGYLANVFNYHIPYSGKDDCAFLLEKVAILTHLNTNSPTAASAKHRSLVALKEEISAGWPISEYFDISVMLLIREAFIEAEEIGGEIQYRISRLGKIVIEKIYFSLAYIENIVFGTLLPTAVIDAAHSTYRTTDRQWIEKYIANSYLFLASVAWAEKAAQVSKGNASMKFFERIRQCIYNSVKNIVQEAEKDNKNEQIKNIQSFLNAAASQLGNYSSANRSPSIN